MSSSAANVHLALNLPVTPETLLWRRVPPALLCTGAALAGAALLGVSAVTAALVTLMLALLITALLLSRREPELDWLDAAATRLDRPEVSTAELQACLAELGPVRMRGTLPAQVLLLSPLLLTVLPGWMVAALMLTWGVLAALSARDHARSFTRQRQVDTLREVLLRRE